MKKRQLTERQAYRGFFIATAAYLTVFASTALPIPLYSVYQKAIGFDNTTIALAMFAYLGGVLFTLLFAGRISDALGRKPATFVTLLLAIIGCVLFMTAADSFAILLARFIQGVAGGLAISAISALAVDCISGYRFAWGSAVAGCAPTVGVMLGSLGVGTVYGSTLSTDITFGLAIALLFILIVLLPLIPEPLEDKATWRSAVKLRVFVPPSAHLLFAVAGFVYIAAWSVATYFQSFSSPLSVDCFHTDSALIASLVLACSMAPSALGGPLTARFAPQKALKGGVVLFAVSTAALVPLLANGWLIPFLVVSGLFSLSMGICVSTIFRMLLLAVDTVDTTAVIASINLTAYVGISLVDLGMGALVSSWSFAMILALLAAGAVLTVAVVFAYARKRARDAARAEQAASETCPASAA